MLITHQHPHNKSIMASVLGAPNVGKSSLINYLLGQDLSVVTHKPQTTRNKFQCVFTIDRTEVILVDTPGLHRSSLEINKRYNEQAREGAFGADINLILIDLTKEIMSQFTDFKDLYGKELDKTWVIFTKSDRISDVESLPLDEVIDKVKTLFPKIEKYFVVSSLKGENMHLLTGALCDEAKEGPHLYPNGAVSNKNERFFATEYIRQQAFEMLKDEIPYEVAVLIEDFKTKGEDSFIAASIIVNRPSQRAIVVGKKGSVIKEIGIRARKRIEEMTGRKIHLNLHVKVSPKWYKNNFILEELGLPRAVDSARVWKSQ
jgi:GTP-binding protein Era